VNNDLRATTQKICDCSDAHGSYADAIFAGMILSCHTEGDNANDLSHSRAKPSASARRAYVGVFVIYTSEQFVSPYNARARNQSPGD